LIETEDVMRVATISAIVVACLQMSVPAGAASLSVAPVIIDLPAPTSASSLRIRNDGQKPINVQVRLFRWIQKNGEDVLLPTSDVVASPPMATLKPTGENIVRVVRTSKRPVQGEESYRMLVDELPDPSRRVSGTVVLVVRQSIPIFFSQTDPANPAANWSVKRGEGGYKVTVTNGSAKRLKISNLTLSNGKTTVAQRKGLVGYALGKSTVSWFLPATAGSRVSGRSVSISADSEVGRIDATASVSGG
jgi:fimbrial chaperone protein